MLAMGLGWAGSLYTFNKVKNSQGEASHGAFILDLGQLPQSVFFLCGWILWCLTAEMPTFEFI